MVDAIISYLWGDKLFIVSPIFFFLFAGPSLYLFVSSILRDLLKGAGQPGGDLEDTAL